MSDFEKYENIVGIIPDKKDNRDLSYENTFVVSDSNNQKSETPKRITRDLRDECMPEIYDQLNYGSCGSNAGMRLYEYAKNKIFKKMFPYINYKKVSNTYSRMALWDYARYLYNKDISQNSGTMLRDNLKALVKWGILMEKDFPYETTPYNKFPSPQLILDGDNLKARAYYRVTTKEGINHALANGRLVAISTNVYKFTDARGNGYSKNILSLKEKCVPNHAMVICADLIDHDYLGQKLDTYCIANSWNKNWGENGYCYCPVDIMWEYNIYDAWVLIEDEFAGMYDNPIDEPLNKSILDLIPNDSVIYKNIGYSQEYMTNLHDSDINKFNELVKSLGDDIEKVFTKGKDGKWYKFRDTYDYSIIKAPIKYYKGNGETEIIG